MSTGRDTLAPAPKSQPSRPPLAEGTGSSLPRWPEKPFAAAQSVCGLLRPAALTPPSSTTITGRTLGCAIGSPMQERKRGGQHYDALRRAAIGGFNRALGLINYCSDRWRDWRRSRSSACLAALSCPVVFAT